MRWADFDPAHRRADRRRRRARAVAAHPAGRRHRRVQPDRHPARRRRDRRAGARAPAPCCTSTACTSPRTRRSTSPRSARTSSSARRTSSSARTAACWPPRPTLLETLRPTSCCPRPTPCRSASSWAPCPTSCWPARTAAVDFLAGLAPAATGAPAGAAASPPWPRSRRTRTRCGSASRTGSPRWPASPCTPGPPPHPDPAAHLRRAATPHDAYRFLAERGVNAPGRLVLRAGGLAAASAWATRAALRVGLAPYSDRRRRRPAARRAGDFLAQP